MLDSTLFSRHLEDDEIVSAIVHKHWLLGLQALLPPIVSFLLSLFVLAGTKVQIAFYVVALWSMISLVWVFRNFFDYYLDAWLITSMGIIDLEWHGWFHRQASRILYSDIQGVSYEINGVLGTLFRFGKIEVEKVSTGTSIALPYVPRPRTVEAMILKNMESYLHSKNMKDAKHVQELLASLVAGQVQIDELKTKKIPIAQNSHVERFDAAIKKPSRRSHSFQSSKIGSKKQ